MYNAALVATNRPPKIDAAAIAGTAAVARTRAGEHDIVGPDELCVLPSLARSLALILCLLDLALGAHDDDRYGRMRDGEARDAAHAGGGEGLGPVGKARTLALGADDEGWCERVFGRGLSRERLWWRHLSPACRADALSAVTHSLDGTAQSS